MRWANSDRNLSLSNAYSPNESVVALSPVTIKLYYPEKIALAPGETGCFTAVFSNPKETAMDMQLQLVVPYGWQVSPQMFDVHIPEADKAEIIFSVTAPKNDTRTRAQNPMDFHCTVNGLSYVVTAGLAQTVDFLCVATENDGTACPTQEVLNKGQVLSAYSHFFPLGDKKQVCACGWMTNLSFPTTAVSMCQLSIVRIIVRS